MARALMKASVMSDSAELLLPCQYLSIHLSRFCCSHSDVAVPPAQPAGSHRCMPKIAWLKPFTRVSLRAVVSIQFGRVRKEKLCIASNAVAVDAVFLTMTIKHSSIQHLLFVTINLRQGGAFVL